MSRIKCSPKQDTNGVGHGSESVLLGIEVINLVTHSEERESIFSSELEKEHG